ncbi:MAG: TauD/TfdA family dioxygenase [Pseudomonadales bacterium]|nr:TauD/TfdA family dioxygenase [Pseudomonadales bacterium]
MPDLPCTRLIGAIGAQCRGIDVRTLAAEDVRRAMTASQLLVFRDQQLTPATLTEFAARLGELDRYPFAEPLDDAPYVVRVLKEPQDRANFGGAWHTDTAYLTRPPSYTLLYAKEVPEIGGDTLFADLYGAYEEACTGLAPAQRERLDAMRVHCTASLVHDAQGAHAAVAGERVARRPAAVATEADHPLVRLHPDSGRRALYVSLIHCAHIVGMSRAESLPVLERLHALIVRAENCTRLRWRAGTLAIWDNRCLLHNPLNDYPGARREMQRVIVRGEVPLAGSG